MTKLFKHIPKRNAKRPNLPKLLILGSQKAGTTTLFDMLDGAGQLKGASTKEIGYFSKDAFYNKGLTWYESFFPTHDSNLIGFEATPEYLYYDFVPERIKRTLPDAKFIVLLREPAARCLSAWNMFRLFNRDQPQAIYEHFTQYANKEARLPLKELLFAKEFPSLESCIEHELSIVNSITAPPEPSFVRRGLYAQQIQRYLELFDRERFVFLEQGDLNDLKIVSHQIEKLMGIELDTAKLKNLSSNQGEYNLSDTKTNTTLDKLRHFFQPYNEQLFNLIGRRFDW